jgi:hypothetical protein
MKEGKKREKNAQKKRLATDMTILFFLLQVYAVI